MEIDYASTLNNNYDLLARSIDPNVRFINKLFMSKVLSQSDVDEIKSRSSVDEKNDSLLMGLIAVTSADRGEECMRTFLKVLRECRQDHVANVFENMTDSIPMSQQHYDVLTSKISKLKEILDPDSGVIDILVSCGVFTMSDKQSIGALSPRGARTSAFVEMLLRRPDFAYESFIDALHKTGQGHIALMLNRECDAGGGDSGADDTENLPMSDGHCRALKNAISKISDLLDPESGIVETLFSRDIFTPSDKERIASCNTYKTMAFEIVSTLTCKSDRAFRVFLDALVEHDQEHVAYLVTGGASSAANQPVREEFIENMRKRRSTIIESMDLISSGLLDMLIGCRVVGSYDRIDPPRHGQPRVTEASMNVEILRLIPRRSQAAFDRFILGLVATRQSHVAQMFIGEEINGKLLITFQDELKENNIETDGVEQRLKIKLNELINDGSGMLPQGQILSCLYACEVCVSYIKDGCIAIGFRCQSADGLHKLRDLYDRRELDRLFTDTFQPMFANDGVVSLRFQIPDEEFVRCADSFLQNAPMSSVNRQALLTCANLPKVCEELVVSNDLLDRLSLCDRRKHAIQCSSGEQQVATLLQIISHQPNMGFDRFIVALRETGQNEVAHIICDMGEGDHHLQLSGAETTKLSCECDVDSQTLESNLQSALLSNHTDVSTKHTLYIFDVPDGLEDILELRLEDSRLGGGELEDFYINTETCTARAVFADNSGLFYYCDATSNS